MIKKLLFTFFLITTVSLVSGQIITTDSTKKDSSMLLNMDAVYNRPFLQMGKIPIAIGGYVEANGQYLGTDGVSEGFSFQMRRFTIFMSSTIMKKIKFLAEVEFEDGTKEINIEFAAIDLEFHPMLNLRAGIIMNPIGAFNQNHDGPKWEFIDRPIEATQLLPATWSNVGAGIHGKLFKKNWAFAYELYLTNGFNANIISNDANRTSLAAAKLDIFRFEESFNGSPLTTAKIAIKNRKIGELGISYMGGIYNKFKDDGIRIDKERRVDAMAIDFNTTLPKINTYINIEASAIWLDIPSTYTQQFGSLQWGGFIDIVQPIVRKRMFGWKNASINLAFRAEYVDWNVGTFIETGGDMVEDVVAITPGISFRPSRQTVIRVNYKYQWTRDILGNPPSHTGGFQFGVASYF